MAGCEITFCMEAHRADLAQFQKQKAQRAHIVGKAIDS
jgi:hypothetical protein